MLNHLRFPCTLLSLATLSGAAAALQPLVTDDTGTQGTSAQQFEISRVQAQAALESERTHTHTHCHWL